MRSLRWFLCLLLVLLFVPVFVVADGPVADKPIAEKPSLGEPAAVNLAQGEMEFREKANQFMSRDVRKKLKIVAVMANWPGGALSHTAFHGSYTTRYLLLRSCKSSSELAKYLKLDKKQLGIVQELEVIEQIQPQNEQPDLEVIAPGYFSFLNEEQMLKLDLIAMQYDGYWALTRKSFAKRLELSKETQKNIAAVIKQVRDDLVMPRFRHEFAAPLPEDWKYDSMRFSGSVATYANIKIVDQMSDQECERLMKLIFKNQPPQALQEELREMVSLPDGVMNLRQEEDEGDKEEQK